MDNSSLIKKARENDYKKIMYYCRLGQNKVNPIVTFAGKYLDYLDSINLVNIYFLTFLYAGWRLIQNADPEKASLIINLKLSELDIMDTTDWGTFFSIVKANGDKLNLLSLLIPAVIVAIVLMYITKLLVHKSFVPAFRYLNIVFGLIDVFVWGLVIDFLLYVLDVQGIFSISQLVSALGEDIKSTSFLAAVLVVSIPVCAIKYIFWGSEKWGYKARIFSVRSLSLFHKAALKKVEKDIADFQKKYSIELPYNFCWKEKGEFKNIHNQLYENLMAGNKAMQEAGPGDAEEE